MTDGGYKLAILAILKQHVRIEDDSEEWQGSCPRIHGLEAAATAINATQTPASPSNPHTSPIREAGDEEVVKLAEKMVAYDEGPLELNGLWFPVAVKLARAYLTLRAHGRTAGTIEVCENFYATGCADRMCKTRIECASAKCPFKEK